MIQEKQLTDLKDAFLDRGGTYLRRNTTKQGEPIIEQINKINTKWHRRLTFSTPELRDKNFTRLTRKHKQFFKASE